MAPTSPLRPPRCPYAALRRAFPKKHRSSHARAHARSTVRDLYVDDLFSDVQVRLGDLPWRESAKNGCVKFDVAHTGLLHGRRLNFVLSTPSAQQQAGGRGESGRVTPPTGLLVLL